MNCPHCGTETAGFVCPSCGGAVPAPGPTAIGGPPPMAAQPRQIVVADPNEAKNWATGAHLAALAGMVIPFANVFGPLVVWLIKRDESSLVDREGKEALNFQISMTIYMVIASLSMLVLIGFLLLPAVAILDLVFTIVAAVKTSNGEQYTYPLSIRFIR